MRSTLKPHRAVVELTDDEEAAFQEALDHHQADREHRVTRQLVLRRMIAAFCTGEGVRFPPAQPYRPRRASDPAAAR
jgi:hypothetical protein